ncbi:MAG TPA: hypothetical protein P5329_01315, partial [Candidatus Competibacteraceae bacterium]|nr:hypothetical protein [Candidatus Competibacteraceae bacterium]
RIFKSRFNDDSAHTDNSPARYCQEVYHEAVGLVRALARNPPWGKCDGIGGLRFANPPYVLRATC